MGRALTAASPIPGNASWTSKGGREKMVMDLERSRRSQ